MLTLDVEMPRKSWVNAVSTSERPKRIISKAAMVIPRGRVWLISTVGRSSPAQPRPAFLPDKWDQSVADLFRVGFVAFQFPFQKSLLQYAPQCQHRDRNDCDQSRNIGFQPERRANGHWRKARIHRMPH